MKCKIYNGQKIADVVGYLEGYPAVFVVADRNVARFAEEIAGCVSMPEGGKIFYVNATEALQSTSPPFQDNEKTGCPEFLKL